MRHMPKARADTLLDLLQREEPIDVDLIKCHNSLANSNVARNASIPPAAGQTLPF